MVEPESTCTTLAAGESCSACRGSRIRKAPGRDTKTRGGSNDRLDAPLPAFLSQVEPLRLAAPGLRIHDQHGMGRAPDPDEVRRFGAQLPARPLQRVPRGQHGHAAQGRDEDQPPDADIGEVQAGAERRDGRHRHDHGDHPHHAAP